MVSSTEAKGAVAFELNQKTYVPIFDLVGNTLALVDSVTNQIVESYSYKAFGEESLFNEKKEKIETSKVNNPWRYRGLRKDSVTGFVLMSVRDYAPELHRFICCDPMGFLVGPNFYCYALNNPLLYSDNSGLAPEIAEPCTCHDDCAFYTTGRCGHAEIPSLNPDLFPEKKTFTSKIKERNETKEYLLQIWLHIIIRGLCRAQHSRDCFAII